jgi:hypothetical protein
MESNNDRKGLLRATESSRSARTALLAALLCLLTGCSNLEVFLGLRMRLDKVPVTHLTATLTPAQGIAPGAAGNITLVAATDAGTTYATVGAGGGKVLFDSYKLDVSIVTVNSKGLVSMPADARVSDGRVGHLTATVVSHPDVAAELDIPVRYDADFKASFSGSPGMDGLDGSDGLAGIAGSMGSIDPNNPSAGGDGGNGSNGSDGGEGGNGQAGPALFIWVTLRSMSQPLLQARVSNGGKDQYFLIDPQQGSLTVTSDGGRAGSGGRGGAGGAGGAGGSGNPSGSYGMSGMDGRNGWDGLPGPAGHITATIDPTAEPYLARLHLSTHDGSGAAGPQPQIIIGPVGALW